jgi:hypothetical protein
MDKIPLSFELKGKQYSGVLSAVAGVGQSSAWHLLIDNYYYGQLMHTDRGWVFHSEKMPEIGDYLAEYVIAWYQ